MSRYIFILSFIAFAENISETTYTIFDGGSMLDITVTADIGDNIAVKGTYSIVDTIIGSANKFDIMGGFKINTEESTNTKESTLLFLGGMRKSEYNTGLLISADFRTKYSEKIFMHDILEFISWSDSNVTALASKFLLGYHIDENISIKGGITWVQSQSESEIGLTFGVETSF